MTAVVNEIAIRTATSSYPAVVGSGVLATIGERAAPLVRGPQCAVVADATTAPLFSERIAGSLKAAGFQPIIITVPAGERSKTVKQLAAVCDEMARAGLDRSSFVVALGGGVVGDLAGFAAAVYHRGIPYLQVPTTLLAQVDSSIGGKTAVNTAFGKNLLGAVHQPVMVIADIDTLDSLPARELNQGFAEVIKHAAIADASMFKALEHFDRRHLDDLVQRNIAIKAAIIADDENDRSGERAVLNFGHTVGHAIERAAGYGALLHGEAVSLGLVVACQISVRRCGLSAAERDLVIAALQRFSLPTRLPDGFPRERILPALAQDKKFERAEIRFVVTPQLGTALLSRDITMDDIAQAIAAL